MYFSLAFNCNYCTELYFMLLYIFCCHILLFVIFLSENLATKGTDKFEIK